MMSVLFVVEHDRLQLRAHGVMTDEIADLPTPPIRGKDEIRASIVALDAGEVTGLIDLVEAEPRMDVSVHWVGLTMNTKPSATT
jgi:hypothetical protein